MPTNILTKNDAIVEYNNKVMGTNRIKYPTYVTTLAGNNTDHYTGQLKTSAKKTISYDVTGKFPEDLLAETLKAASNTLPQANAAPKEFTYYREPKVVEFVLSNIQSVDTTNIEAGILNRLLMQYDLEAWAGSNGNTGIWTNDNAVELDPTVKTISSASDVLAVVGSLLTEMAIYHGVREANYPEITLSYTPDIAALLKKPIGTTTSLGGTLLSQAYEGMKREEVPSLLGADSHISLTYRPSANFHHGGMPAVYSTEDGAHGLSKSILFAYETAAMELEAKGAYCYQKTKVS